MSRKGLVVTIGILVLGGWNCRQQETPDPQKGSAMPEKTIEQVQQEHTEAWMALPGVVGTAIGQCEGQPCILILTASNTAQVRQRIPATVEGYRIIVQHVGEVHALGNR